MSADDGGMIEYINYMKDPKEYKELRLLGTKKFGELYLMEQHARPGAAAGGEKLVAQRSPQTEDGKVQQALREVEMFIKMRPHPAFCSFKGFFAQPTAVLMEYLPNGTLKQMLTKVWRGEDVPNWTPTVRAKVIFGLAAALMHLHAHNAIHRYITLSSILFDDKWEPRLTDFGFAKVTMDSGVNQTVMSEKGEEDDVIFMAPEMLTDTRQSYSNKVDVFAYGQVLYALVTGLSPVPEAMKAERNTFKKQRLLVDGVRAKIPDGVAEAVATLITNCWDREPGLRPEFGAIVRDLFRYDQPLIPGVDMDEYMEYRMRIIAETSKTPEFLEQVPNPDDEQKFRDVEALAKSGDIRSLISMGRMYEKGQGCEANEERAFQCYSQAAEKGNPIGMYNTAIALLNGIGTPRNPTAAVEWLRRAVDTKKLPSHADLAYAWCLEEGKGIAKNTDEALSIYSRLSQPPLELRDAMHGQARILEAMGRGEEAKTWYVRAGDKGCDKAASDLAVMLLMGKSVPQDIPEGLRRLKMAAERSLPMANHNLGVVYEKGLYGERQDIDKAKVCYKAAAKGGEVLGVLKYTSILFREAAKMEEGPARTDTEKNAANVLRWSLEQQQQRHTVVLYNVGKLKIDGRGLERDVQGGIKLMLESAKKSDGWMAAMYLGNLYANGNDGLGVRQNVTNARNSFNRALAIGRELRDDKIIADAQAALDRLPK